MIFIFNSGGDLIKAVPEKVYQGSNKANRIWFLAPVPQSAFVTVVYGLPNGDVLPETNLSRVINESELPFVDKDNNHYSAWYIDIDAPVTAIAGEVSLQFYIRVLTKTPYVIATTEVTLPIERGVAPLVQPQPTNSYQDLLGYLQILYSQFLNNELKGDKGEQGEQGNDGLSAYQIWLDAGNSGNEIAFLESLKGDKGEQGEKGDAGSIKFISVNSLPTENIEQDAIYLVPIADSTEENRFNEYVYINEKWETLGAITVQVDHSEYVKFTDIATGDKAGVVCVRGDRGITINVGTGLIETLPATDAELNSRAWYKPITAGVLDKAVKVGITTNTETLTDEEKANACEWLGATRKHPPSQGTLRVWVSNGTTGYWDVVQSNQQSSANGNIAKYQDENAGTNEYSGYLQTHTPKNPYHCANKKYVDDAVANAGGGGYIHYLAIAGSQYFTGSYTIIAKTNSNTALSGNPYSTLRGTFPCVGTITYNGEQRQIHSITLGDYANILYYYTTETDTSLQMAGTDPDFLDTIVQDTII